MADRNRPLFLQTPVHRQRGQALFVLLMILVVAGSAVFYSFAGSANSAIERDQITAAALAQAKEALIGYAAADANRPGSLPCPDTGNSGSVPLFAGVECPSYIGRLPWRTLGLPDLRDGSGERLWYAVTREFARNPSCGSSCPLNSDTEGTLVITGTAPAADVIAIVFSPGQALSPQDRSPAGENAVANYLEGGNEIGITTNTYVTGQVSDTFNDKLLAITSDALFHVVAARVAREVYAALEKYFNRTEYYPRANPFTDSEYYCDLNTYEGRVPLIMNSFAPPKGCQSGSLPVQDNWAANELPTWFGTNNWNLVTRYAVAPYCTQVNLDALGLSACLNLAVDLLGTYQPLTVTGVTSPDRKAIFVIIVTGRALSPQTAPCSTDGGATNRKCLDDTANHTQTDNQLFTKPSRWPSGNDRMAIKCATSTPCDIVP
jgi:hypothetical protein